MPEPIAILRGFPAPSGLVDLEIHVGDILLLAGGNGAGKTSLLRSLAGLPAPLQPESVRLATGNPRTLPAPALASQVHLALQDPAETLIGLTVAGEFRLRGQVTPATLADLADRDVATLSSGQARRVSLSLVTSSDAPLLLLDEPVEGLDVASRQALLETIRNQALRGAVVAADHSGLLAPLATSVVQLQEHLSPLNSLLPPAGLRTRLSSAAAKIQRGPTTLQFSAITFPTGFHVIQGPNGSGKSTFLLHLAGILGHDAFVDGLAPVAGGNIQLLLPRATDLFTHDTVGDELAKIPPAWQVLFVPTALLWRHPLSLSAGEAQRVALAKTLGRPAPCYLLDEPEAHLDPIGRAALISAIARRLAEGCCIVAATHDRELFDLAHSVTKLELP